MVQEVYKDSPPHHIVCEQMYNLGYRIFDAQVAACWKQKNKTNKSLYGKEKKIGFNIYLLKHLKI